MERGFTLIEAVVAITVLTVGIGAAYVLIGRTALSIESVGNRFEAVYLAQEGLELVRQIRDTNFLNFRQNPAGTDLDNRWKQGLDGCASGCQLDYNDSTPDAYDGSPLLWNEATGYTYDSGIATPFRRKITITIENIEVDGEQEPDKALIEVIVSWEEEGSTRTVTVSSELYQWLLVPSPYRFNERVESVTENSATIAFDTDREASCRYSATSNVRYDDMVPATAFTMTDNGDGTFEQKQTIGGLDPATLYTFYIRCNGIDREFNKNPSDFEIQATTASAS